MAEYQWRDGSRVAPGTLSAFDMMDAEFVSVFGVHLRISSGTRTNAEQTQIFVSRYVRAGDVNGRRVYDTRWWNGVLWYRVSSAGTVAVPGTSNHENDRALDIRDDGSDAGVTSAGNARSNWIRANAHRFGFAPNGYGFGEPWHIEFQGDPWAGGGSAAGGSSDDIMNAEEQNALFSTWKALFQGGGDAGDQSVISRLVEIQQSLRAIAPRVVNIDQQTTGADNFDKKVGPSIAGRLIAVQKSVSEPARLTLDDGQIDSFAAALAERGIAAGATVEEVRVLLDEALAALTLKRV